jgi:hypothetical protein
MQKLKLTVNETKTRVCRLPEEKFDFLGYTLGRCHSMSTRIFATVTTDNKESPAFHEWIRSHLMDFSRCSARQHRDDFFARRPVSRHASFSVAARHVASGFEKRLQHPLVSSRGRLMNRGPSALIRYVGAGPTFQEPEGLAKRSPANQVVQ